MFSDRAFYEYMEDLDGDGKWETIRTIKHTDGRIQIDIVDDDGVIHRTILDSEGNLSEKSILIPDPDNPGKYRVYVWDEKTKTYKLEGEQEDVSEPPDPPSQPTESSGPIGSGGGGGGDHTIM